MKALEIIGWIVIIVVMSAVLDAFLNWGRSYPWLSTIVMMVVVGTLWQMLIRWSPKPDSGKSQSTTKTETSSDGSTVNQSAPVTQSATASGSATVNQAGRDLTINHGVQEETMREMLKQKSLAGMAHYAESYPHGYIIFGLADGQIIYESKLRDIVIETDWDTMTINIDLSDNSLLVQMPTMIITKNGIPGSLWHGNVERIPLVENAPVESHLSGMWYDIIDAPKKIFLIGFK